MFRASVALFAALVVAVLAIPVGAETETIVPPPGDEALASALAAQAPAEPSAPLAPPPPLFLEDPHSTCTPDAERLCRRFCGQWGCTGFCVSPMPGQCQCDCPL